MILSTGRLDLFLKLCVKIDLHVACKQVVLYFESLGLKIFTCMSLCSSYFQNVTNKNIHGAHVNFQLCDQHRITKNLHCKFPLSRN